jgi:hypothetical protein
MAIFDGRQTAGRQAGEAKMENQPVKINVALARGGAGRFAGRDRERRTAPGAELRPSQTNGSEILDSSLVASASEWTSHYSLALAATSRSSV